LAFTPRSIELSGSFVLSAPPEAVFELFSPLGEKAWVPGWNPELLHPPGVSWEPGLVFRTVEERGEAIWVVAALDRARHDVEYYRLEPGRYAARVRVRCTARGVSETEVHVSYMFAGLSETGNGDIAAMSAPLYAEKMRRWKEWIDRARTGGRPPA
jgi:hypothetical protein